MTVEAAADALSNGEPVLLYDSDGREAETDIVLPAASVTWEDVRFLRNEAGGLLCVALPHDVARRFDLPLLAEAFDGFGPPPSYGDRSSFSVTVNHRSTHTGVTDRDRATTVRKVAEAVGSDEFVFRDEFRSPGHVHLLVAAEELLEARQGHTEMAVWLAQEAGITSAVALCEMLDDGTGKALPRERAEQYAAEHDLPFVAGRDMR